MKTTVFMLEKSNRGNEDMNKTWRYEYVDKP